MSAISLVIFPGQSAYFSKAGSNPVLVMRAISAGSRIASSTADVSLARASAGTPLAVTSVTQDERLMSL